MNLRLIILSFFIWSINSASDNPGMTLKSGFVIKNSYYNVGITNNIELTIVFKDNTIFRKVLSYSDAEFFAKPFDNIKALYYKGYGKSADTLNYALSFVSETNYDLYQKLNDKEYSKSISEIEITTAYNWAGQPSYKETIKEITVEKLISPELLESLNKKDINTSIEYLSKNKKDNIIYECFPGLSYRGRLNIATTIEDLGRYVLNLPDGYSQNDIFYNYRDVITKWIMLKDYFTEKKQVKAIENCNKIIGFVTDILKHLKPKDRAEITLSQDEFKAIFEGLSDNNKKLISAVSKYYQNLDDSQKRKIYTQILLGEKVYSDILKNNKEKNVLSIDENVKNLIWFLFAMAIAKNQGFEEGTFVIEDPEFKIYDYLKDISLSRHSSHFKEHAKTQMGIDVLGLPAEKQTLLFGIANKDKQLIFIKPENYGVYTWWDTIMHGVEFGHAQGRKWLPATFGSDDQENWRKERVPKDAISKYKSLRQELLTANLIQPALEPKDININTIYIELKNWLAQNESEGLVASVSEQNKSIIDKVQAFKKELEDKYDNLDIRYGREVILLQKSLENISNLYENTIKELDNALHKLSAISK